MFSLSDTVVPLFDRKGEKRRDAKSFRSFFAFYSPLLFLVSMFRVSLQSRSVSDCTATFFLLFCGLKKFKAVTLTGLTQERPKSA